MTNSSVYAAIWNVATVAEAVLLWSLAQRRRYRALPAFAAAINEPTPPHAYRRLNIPTLLLQGEHSPPSVQLIAGQLARALKFSSLQTVYGAGHMGPLSDAAAVSAMMTDWIVRAEPSTRAGGRNVTPKFDCVA